MKRCTSCGYELPDEAMFCSSCGAKVEPLEVEVIETADTSEFDIVCKLYQLEQSAQEASNKLRIEGQAEYSIPKPKPPESVHYSAERYPALIPQYSVPVWWILTSIVLICIPVFGWCVWLFLWGVAYYPEKQRMKQKSLKDMQNSDSYRNICHQIDLRNNENREKAELQYRLLYAKYDKDQLQPWLKCFREWNAEHEQICAKALTEIQTYNRELKTLYDECKLFPTNYRNFDAICGVYEIMKTSNYTVREALEIYDRNKQMELTRQHIAAQQNTAQELAYQNSALDAQNELLYMQAQLADEANAIAEEARRDANRAAFVATVQRHNTNKALNKLVRK